MPWVTALIYQSVADPQAYYIAFEDLPTCRELAAGKGCNVGTNDGDFNDFVFYVTRPVLQPRRRSVHGCRTRWGSARAASPSAPGAGRPRPAARPSCRPPRSATTRTTTATAMVDEGDPLPAQRGLQPGRLPALLRRQRVPLRGRPDLRHHRRPLQGPRLHRQDLRRRARSASAAPAWAAATASCARTDSPAGSASASRRATAITCPADRVCENGACQPPCNNKCRSCKAGFELQHEPRGVCLETGCENKTCPAGQVCVAGTCKDGCEGVTCPGGQECMMGSCIAGADARRGHAGGLGRAGRVRDPGERRSGRGGRRERRRRGRHHHGRRGGQRHAPARTAAAQDPDLQLRHRARGRGRRVALLLAGLAVAVGRRRRAAAARARK